MIQNKAVAKSRDIYSMTGFGEDSGKGESE